MKNDTFDPIISMKNDTFDPIISMKNDTFDPIISMRNILHTKIDFLFLKWKMDQSHGIRIILLKTPKYKDKLVSLRRNTNITCELKLSSDYYEIDDDVDVSYYKVKYYFGGKCMLTYSIKHFIHVTTNKSERMYIEVKIGDMIEERLPLEAVFNTFDEYLSSYPNIIKYPLIGAICDDWKLFDLWNGTKDEISFSE